MALPRNHPNHPEAKRIAPGIWLDADGVPHWSIAELLALVDLPDTAENRAQVAAMLKETMLKHQPDAKIFYRETPEDKGKPL